MPRATSPAIVLPTTAGSAQPHSVGNIDIRTGLILGVGGIIGTLIGAYAANLIPSYILKKLVGILLLITAVPMIRRFLNERKEAKTSDMKKENEKTDTITGPKRIIASFFGVARGILAGVFGLSGTGHVTAGLYSLGLSHCWLWVQQYLYWFLIQ